MLQTYPALDPTEAADAVDLGGRWLFRADPQDLGEHYRAQLAYTHADDARWMSPDHPTDEWGPIAVPGCWTAQGHGEVERGWYRTTFPMPLRPGRSTLDLGRVFYSSDVWLNGRYLGYHEGYVADVRFDVTQALRATNVLVVKVCGPRDVLSREDQVGQLKRHFGGALSRVDVNDPDFQPVGIWGPVRLLAHGPVVLVAAQLDYSILDLPCDGGLGDPVTVRAVLTCDVDARAPVDGVDIVLVWDITEAGSDRRVAEGRSTVPAVAGRRTVVAELEAEVSLWYTWDLGPQSLYDVTATVMCAGARSDSTAWRTGFRQIGIGEGWDLTLNGLSFYQRGANYFSDVDPATMTTQRYRHDVDLARGANLNTIHPFCIVEGDDLYDLCDERGLLVYQDFPLWMMADTGSDTVRRAVSQYDDMLLRLRRHPAVAVWNVGSQPSIANVEKLSTALVARATALDPARVANHGGAAVSYDPTDDTHPTRSLFWSEDDAARLERDYAWRRDSHMYPGWYFGDIRAIRAVPVHHFGLVTEVGAQSLPRRELLDRIAVSRGAIDWRLVARHCGQPALLREHAPAPEGLDDLISSTQQHQAELLRHHIEYVRSLKGRPGHGVHVFSFVDAWPSVTWSIVDHDRAPKAAWSAVRDAMEPVHVMVDDPLQRWAVGSGAVDVVVVNDTARGLDAAWLTLCVRDPSGAQVWAARAPTRGPTDVAVTTRLPLELPGVGEFLLEVRLEHGSDSTTSTYRIAAEPPGTDTATAHHPDRVNGR